MGRCNRRTFDSNLICFNCNGQGHVQRDCSSPRKPRVTGQPRFQQPQRSTRNFHSGDHPKPQLNVVAEPGDAVDTMSAREQNPEVDINQDVSYIHNLNNKDMKLPLYDVVCNDGRVLKAILDTGASANYVSPKAAFGLEWRKVKGKEVMTAGGHTSNIQYEVTIQADIAGFSTSSTLTYSICNSTLFSVEPGTSWSNLFPPGAQTSGV